MCCVLAGVRGAGAHVLAVVHDCGRGFHRRWGHEQPGALSLISCLHMQPGALKHHSSTGAPQQAFPMLSALTLHGLRSYQCIRTPKLSFLRRQQWRRQGAVGAETLCVPRHAAGSAQPGRHVLLQGQCRQKSSPCRRFQGSVDTKNLCFGVRSWMCAAWTACSPSRAASVAASTMRCTSPRTRLVRHSMLSSLPTLAGGASSGRGATCCPVS